MANLAIIPARGGSKRIPKKNIKDFLGKPVLAYAIQAALESGVFDEVMVSTDSEEIAEVARKYGAKVPFMRSEKAANDFATTRDVLVEVLEEYEKRGQTFEYMSCIYPGGGIFVTGDTLKNAMELLVNNDVDCVRPCVEYSSCPQRAMVIRNGGLVYAYPEYFLSRTQDLEKMYLDPGQYYIYRVDRYLNRAEKTNIEMPVIISENEAQDIDNPSDWVMAELKYNLLHGKE